MSFPWNLAAKRNFAVLQKGYVSSARHGRRGTSTSAETNTRCRCAGHLPFCDDTKKIKTLKKLKVIKENNVKSSVCVIYHIEVREMIQLFD